MAFIHSNTWSLVVGMWRTHDNVIIFLPTLLFGLNLRDAMISGLIGMIIGCLVPAYSSTMGPKSGCRQMVTARFLFGQWGQVCGINLYCWRYWMVSGQLCIGWTNAPCDKS